MNGLKIAENPYGNRDQLKKPLEDSTPMTPK
jgi:hypothetical protein